VVGVNATGANQGEFILNDLGTAVAGGGTRRLTIDNAGQAAFAGTVTAQSFPTPSSIRFKTDVAPLALPADWPGAFAAAGDAAGSDYGRLTALLVERLKAQQRELEALQAAVAELQRLLAELSALRRQ